MAEIRVLQVLGGLNRGGAETMVMNLYRAIDKNKVQFDFIVHNENENAYFDEVKRLGGRIFVFPSFSPQNFLKYRRYWKRFLTEHSEYKILHSHVRSYALFFIGIAKREGLKTIVHSHSTSNGRGVLSAIKALFQLPIRKKSDYLFACSTISGEWLFGKKAINAENYRMIKNAIDTPKYTLSESIRSEQRSALGITDELVFGHVGRLSEPKNHKFLLDVFSEILKKEPKSKLLIVGEGPLRTQIGSYIDALGLREKVIMTGVRSDIPMILQSMDVFLFPSLWEGLPVTVIEAQASGLPCLVSDKVTREVAVSEAVEYLSIEEGIDIWVEKALQLTGKRFNVQDKIIASGFDVSASSAELNEFYQSIVDG